MAFKMKGYSAFTKKDDPGKLKKFKKEPKETKKRILNSTQTDSGMMTEYSGADDKNRAIVYRKGGKKYTKELDLEFNPTGEYRQLKRKDIKKLKKEGSLVKTKKRKNKMTSHNKSARKTDGTRLRQALRRKINKIKKK